MAQCRPAHNLADLSLSARAFGQQRRTGDRMQAAEGVARSASSLILLIEKRNKPGG